MVYEGLGSCLLFYKNLRKKLQFNFIASRGGLYTVAGDFSNFRLGIHSHVNVE